MGNCYTTTCRVVHCLRLWTHSKQIPHQCHTYARCLRTFICCGWAHGPVLTQFPVPHQTSFWKLSLNLGNCHATTCRVVHCLRLWTHSKQIPHQCHTYARCLRTFICCGWAHGHVLNQFPHSHLSRFWKPGLNFGQVPGHKL